MLNWLKSTTFFKTHIETQGISETRVTWYILNMYCKIERVNESSVSIVRTQERQTIFSLKVSKMMGHH